MGQGVTLHYHLQRCLWRARTRFSAADFFQNKIFQLNSHNCRHLALANFHFLRVPAGKHWIFSWGVASLPEIVVDKNSTPGALAIWSQPQQQAHCGPKCPGHFFVRARRKNSYSPAWFCYFYLCLSCTYCFFNVRYVPFVVCYVLYRTYCISYINGPFCLFVSKNGSITGSI